MRYFVIYNPHARGGRGAADAHRCLALLSRAGCTFDAAETQRFDNAFTLSREANQRGYDAVLAIGGDGTINKVLNGFFDENGMRISRARFGVVHTGTSPDFCRSYGLPLGIDDAVGTILHGRTRPIPVGMIRFPLRSEADGRAVRYFACCANIGLGATLAARANAGIRKRLGDTMGTLWSLLLILRTYTPDSYECIIDGSPLRLSAVYNISIGLTPHIASGIKVANEEYRRAGQFYLMTLRAVNTRNLLPLLRLLYRGKKFADTDYLSVRGCTILRIEERAVRGDVEHDGDPCGVLPCEISIAAQPLDLLCRPASGDVFPGRP